MRTVRILEEASQEAIEAAAWYEYEHPGLGAEFLAAVEAALNIIEENVIPLTPLLGEAGDIGAKRLILEHFPSNYLLPSITVEKSAICVG